MKHEDFIESLSFDERLADVDMEGSIAHARMLAQQGIITHDDMQKIVAELTRMRKEHAHGTLALAGEDIHFALEHALIKRIGPVGGKLHTARSRNDQVALDMRLYLKREIPRQCEALVTLIGRIQNTALKNRFVIMPGYTHLQEAQPVLFSHYLLSFAWMFVRDSDRLVDCLDRLDENPLGACALAGTSFPIDRSATARSLGFRSITQNSIDSVSDRDFIVEYLSGIAITLVHCSRFAEDFIIWASAPFGFVTLPERFSSGSSIMPQKRNPDYLELLRAQSALVTGQLTGMLSMMKGLPLAYNRDMQDDKRLLFGAHDIFEKSIAMLTDFIAELEINTAAMEQACARGYLEATELADYLSRKGVPFRTAHTIVKDIVRLASKRRCALKDIPLAEYAKHSRVFTQDVYDALDLRRIVNAKRSAGGTSASAVSAQVRALDQALVSFRKRRTRS